MPLGLRRINACRRRRRTGRGACDGRLKARLAELGEKSHRPTRQVDAYYNASHRDFLASEVISEWLRLRTEDHGASINFKRWHPVDAVVQRLDAFIVDLGIDSASRSTRGTRTCFSAAITDRLLALRRLVAPVPCR
ncbi:CYTH domain-containing protein [Micromonospora sp. KC207]|uniref:CYTH domain-containing protein n=1 Tax=Micromonospora sp. KC207 TaxID=2530377 RepID=UPI0014051257|nr:CYTH domain-containing protein [Micromonospora sp. KC207]